jgi:HSP90 family molecular chaperone
MIKVMSKKLVRKALEMISKLAEDEYEYEDEDEDEDDDDYDNNDRDDDDNENEDGEDNGDEENKYEKFWKAFGKNIKLGVIED